MVYDNPLAFFRQSVRWRAWPAEWAEPRRIAPESPAAKTGVQAVRLTAAR